ncbi:MAG: type I pullulanase [Bacillota bacterium]|nr:type I pullulanase [Bacillota bacterium]
MKAKKMLAVFVVSIMLLGTVLIPSITVNAATAPKSTGYSSATAYDSQTYSGSDLGATYSKTSTTFKVWAPSASNVQVKLYKTGSDSESGAGVIGTYAMTLTQSNGVWSYTAQGDLNGDYYTYLVTVNGTTNETQDVYSKAVGVNGNRSEVLDFSKTDPTGWSQDQHVLRDSTKDVVWEVNIRDFSIDASSGVSAANRGKYLAFTEGGTKVNGTGAISSCVDYLVDQGVNTVQLMPCFDFASVDETKGGQNWGYDPVNYNVPDGSYSSNPYNGATRITEFKEMVQALHDRGISVIMDVVYNHTYSTASCFEKTVPGYYYRMQNGAFLDGSGCGNVLASDHPMFKKYMADSCQYWVDQYHIDGFRYDLMGCEDITCMNNVRTTLNNDANVPNSGGSKIVMYGEPWTGGSSNGLDSSVCCVKSNCSQLLPGIGMFNDSYRDAVKGSTNGTDGGYIQGSTSNDTAIKSGILANTSSTFGNNWANTPNRTVTYDSAHDNLILWDKLVKSNGITDYQTANASLITQDKLSAALILTSQGIPFTVAGDEFGRTKLGDDNSYNTGDTENHIDWTRLNNASFSNLDAYYKGFRQIRSVYSPFSDSTMTSVGASYFASTPSGVIAYTMQNKTANAANEWGMTAVIANNTSSTQSVTLQAGVSLPSSWATIVNGTSAGLTNLGTINGSTISVPAKTAMVLVDLSSFNSKNIQAPQTSTLTVNHIDASTNTTIKTTTSKYVVGSTYRAFPNSDILFDYTLSNTVGNTSGVITASPVTVSFYYTPSTIPSNTLTVNYVDESGNVLSPAVSTKLHQGDTYSYAPSVIQGYQLDTDKYPANSIGTFAGTAPLTITFTYKPQTPSTTIVHFYNSQSWSSVYCYAYLDNGTKLLGAWAGQAMTADSATGANWYKISISAPSCRVIFSNSSTGSIQVPGQNQPGYLVAGEAWINSSTIQYNATIVTSYINQVTGAKLQADTSTTAQKVTASGTYTTTAPTITGFNAPTAPINASGNYSAGVTNVVYLYTPSGTPTNPSTTLPTQVPTIAPTTPANSYLLGDANQDGVVSLKDATKIQKYLAGVSGITIIGNAVFAADVNSNGSIELKDATSLQKWLANLTVAYAINTWLAIPNPTVAPTTPPTAAPTTTPTVAPTVAPTTAPTQAASTKTIYFKDSLGWVANASAVMYISDGTTSIKMTSLGTTVWSADVPTSWTTANFYRLPPATAFSTAAAWNSWISTGAMGTNNKFTDTSNSAGTWGVYNATTDNPTGTITVYFDNSVAQWSGVYIYLFNQTMVSMTKISGTNIWKASIPVGTGFLFMNINDPTFLQTGILQTDDITSTVMGSNNCCKPMGTGNKPTLSWSVYNP